MDYHLPLVIRYVCENPGLTGPELNQISRMDLHSVLMLAMRQGWIEPRTTRRCNRSGQPQPTWWPVTGEPTREQEWRVHGIALVAAPITLSMAVRSSELTASV